MNDVALFMNALRAAVPTEPDPRLGAELVPRLAAAARASTLEAETRAMRRPRTRLSMLARAGIAVAAVPLLLAGLAFAGVTVPDPARDAFDRVGIELPNQPSSDSAGKSDQESSATKKSAQPSGASGQGNSTEAHQHALQQHQKAKGKAKGHTLGKAIGLHEAIPPGKSGATGPPAHSQAGGSAKSDSAPGRLKVPGPPFPPRGRSGAHGH
jgi:hypothetical protein